LPEQSRRNGFGVIERIKRSFNREEPMQYTVKEMPIDERPREKLLLRGAHNLTDAELLAILLRTGLKGKNVLTLALEILNDTGNLARLATKTTRDLQKIAGIGKDKAATVAAAFEIGRRSISQDKTIMKKKITDPEAVAKYLIPLLRDKANEVFIVVFLNSANIVIGYRQVAEGTLDASIVTPRDVFRAALEYEAKALILVHNHPSGNQEPSSSDITITKLLVQAGTLMNIKILDHIIIAGNNYTSFVERKLL
jgi:DNA repair protein RadC